MVKQKFSSLDITAIVAELQKSILNLRLQNCYDISSKIYLLKFNQPSTIPNSGTAALKDSGVDDGGGGKLNLLIESGTRIHLTDYTREKDNSTGSNNHHHQLPGSFCMKLRKHLRSKRVTAIRQLGVDRIVDMEFGSGEACYHLISEYYAQGNIILTDCTYTIISLLRPVTPDESIRFAVGELYPFQIAKPFSVLTFDRVVAAIKQGGPKDAVKRVLGMKLDYSQPLVEHLLQSASIDAGLKCQKVSDDVLPSLFEALKPGDDILKQMSMGKNIYGCIVMESSVSVPVSDESSETYKEFHPLSFIQFNSAPQKPFETFNRAVDEFYSSLETHKQKAKVEAHISSAIKKIENVRTEHENRVQSLLDSQWESEYKARLIEENLEVVDQSITVIRSALATGMDWNALKQLVAEEQIKKNPIALMISRLKLETNQITLKLDSLDYDDEDDYQDDTKTGEQEKSGAGKVWQVDIDVGLSAFGNARKYYDTRKQTTRKHEKTIEVSERAMKSAEQKIMKEMNNAKVTVTIVKQRKPFWFEKFNWFISSENFLVVSGRDAQQNELLVKKYFRKDDVYIHADIPGSSSVIVKNTCTDPIPSSTLAQAGTMAIVYSKAWDAKVVTSAYWVARDQVSKTAPTGEYLPTGSFMIRGKKNYLPPSQLVYGFGLLFKVSDECIQKHYLERRPHLRGDAQSAEGVDGGDSSTRSASIESLIENAQLEDDDEVDGDQNQQEAEGLSERERAKVTEKVSKVVDKKVKDQKHQPSATKKHPQTSPDQSRQEKDNHQLKQQQQQQQQQSMKKNKQEPLPRGKRSKMKRAKEKYKFQDEEDRKLRMDLIAASGKNSEVDDSGHHQQTGNNGGRLREVDAVAAAEKKAAVAALVPKGIQDSMNDESSETLSDDSLGVLEKEIGEKGAGGGEDYDLKEEEEVEKVGDVAEAEEDELLSEVNQLDTLTGSPMEDDVLLNAVPVCAPYQTLQQYKYKIKLIPGGLKKGKAAKSAHQLFRERKDGTVQEKDLIKAIPETEMIQTILGKVKLMTSSSETGGGGNKKKGKGKK